MEKSRVYLLSDSFKDIEDDMNAAITKWDLELIQYNFLRSFRLLDRISEHIKRSVKENSIHELKELKRLQTYIQQQTSKWKANVAYYYEDQAMNMEAENEWFASISFPNPNPDYFIQYAHTVLKNKNLFVNKDISENIGFVNPFNVKEIKTAIKRVRLAVKSSIAEQGQRQESTIYFLTWLDLLEKEIDSNEELVKAQEETTEQITIEDALHELNRLIGLQIVKRKIKEISDWVTFSQMRREQGFKVDDISLHMVFSGNPGTGKTTVARIVAKIFKALGILKKGHLVETGRSDLVAEYVGQTAVKTMKKIKEAEDGVLFIDEAYSLTRSSGNDFGIEVIDTLVKAMEDKRKNLVIILAGYPNEMKQFIEANPGLYSRFKYHIEFPDYTIPELLDIFDILLKDKQYKATQEAKAIVKGLIEQHIIKNPTRHGNGRLVRNIIEDSILNKAAYVVEQKQNNLPTGELDLIDETILRMVEAGIRKEGFQGIGISNVAKS